MLGASIMPVMGLTSRKGGIDAVNVPAEAAVTLVAIDAAGNEKVIAVYPDPCVSYGTGRQDCLTSSFDPVVGQWDERGSLGVRWVPLSTSTELLANSAAALTPTREPCLRSTVTRCQSSDEPLVSAVSIEDRRLRQRPGRRVGRHEGPRCVWSAVVYALMGGLRVIHPQCCSSCAAIESRRSSRACRATSCTPIGSPSLL